MLTKIKKKLITNDDTVIHKIKLFHQLIYK